MRVETDGRRRFVLGSRGFVLVIGGEFCVHRILENVQHEPILDRL